MIAEASPFLDLFQTYRARFQLSIAQYDDLRQALACGFGLGGWESLRLVCRALWCKQVPGSPLYQEFDRLFDAYVRQYTGQFIEPSPAPTPAPVSPPPPPSPSPTLGQLPTLPPRNRIEPTPQSDPILANVPSAMRSPGSGPVQRGDENTVPIEVNPNQLPLTAAEVRSLWRSLRVRVRSSRQQEVDLPATLAAIEREGIYADVVLRPVLTRKTEALILVDTHNAMIPYRPAIQALLKAVDDRWIDPAERYYFTAYPDDYLFEWDRPTQAQSLGRILPRLHSSRTVVMVISDAGAAMGDRSPERVEGVETWLKQMGPSVRQVLWINPVPAQRWVRSAAEKIASLPGLDMIALDQLADLALMPHTQRRSA
ncbi:MAG TPA: hypothetical protein V6D20_01005 [Candidatus Obscuribacterales bacterium]